MTEDKQDALNGDEEMTEAFDVDLIIIIKLPEVDIDQAMNELEDWYYVTTPIGMSGIRFFTRRLQTEHTETQV